LVALTRSKPYCWVLRSGVLWSGALPDLSSLSGSYLVISLIFSSIGLGYFVYGKKQKHKVAFWSGICLMGYPYMVTDPLAMVVIGVALMFVPRFVRLE
jgi:hypothetical protein